MRRFCNTDSLLDRLDRHARDFRDQTVYTFLREHDVPETLTFGQLADRVRHLAAKLSERLRPGDRAVLLYPQGLEFICAFLGCLAAGVIAVPAYPPRRNRKAERLNAILADCSPAALLTTREVRTALPGDTTSLSVLVTDEWDGEDGPDRDPCVIRPDAVAFLQYTSGSTGTPRGVMVTHENIACNERQIERSFGHESLSGPHPSVMVSWLPLFHDMGLIGGALQPLYVGFPSVLMSPAGFAQEPVRWLRAITTYRGSTAGAPNFAYDLCARVITEEQKEGLDLGVLRVLYNGAEPVRGDTLDRFAAAFRSCGFRPSAFFPCYGMAETTLFVSGGPQGEEPKRMWAAKAALEVGRVEPCPAQAEDARCLVGCGALADGVELVVVDPQARTPSAVREVGELWIRSGAVASGYLGRPDESRLAFANCLPNRGDEPFLATGDLGFLLDGQVYVTGRLKDVVIIRGRNICPSDVEAVVHQVAPFVPPNGCAAFSVPGEAGERLCVVLEGDRAIAHAAKRADAEVPEALSAIRAAVVREFDVIPAEIAVLKPGTFPRTSSGKVRRQTCRQELQQGTLEVVARWRSDGQEVGGAGS